MRHDHFTAVAADYATYRPTYPPALVAWLARLTPGSGLCWEAGCGSGQLSTLLAAHFERVVATDASAAQIASARRLPRVTYRRESAEACSLPAGVADLAVTAQAAHWFDLPAYYAEVRRVVRDRGVVALVTYGNARVDGAVDAIIDDFHSTVLRPFWPPERAHVEDGYAALPFPFTAIAAPTLELRADWGVAELLGYIGTWSAVRRLERAGGARHLHTLQQRLAEAWGGPDVRRVVRWPLRVRAGRVDTAR